MSIQKVAVAGAGSLGSVIVQQLIDDGFDVTVLTRSGLQTAIPSAAKTTEVDYDSIDSLKAALSGQDAVISTVGSAAVAQQQKMLDAVIASSVKRFIPSEFGCDSTNAKARALPVYAQKVAVADQIEQKTKGTETTYTFVYNNAFLDWGIEKGFLINAKEKRTAIFDGGDAPFTVTPLDFIAKGVSAILKKPDETANQHIRLHGAAITQNQLLKMVQSAGGKDGWEVTQKSSAETEKQAYETLKNDPGNVMGWVMGFLMRAVVGEGYGGDFSKNNHNDLLGLKTLNEQEVESVVKSSVATVA
jgi:uncharacterized protein YbjT (DUF2867 family)